MICKKLFKSILCGMLFFGITTSWSFGITDEPAVLYDCLNTEFDVVYETYELVMTEKFRFLCGKQALLVTLDSERVGRLGYLVSNIDLACSNAEEMWDIFDSEERKSFYFLEIDRSTD